MEQLSCKDDNLLRVICDVGEIKTMKATVTSCVESGIIVGLATTIGALLAGPRGIALGAAAGAAGLTIFKGGQFKSVPEILKNDTTIEQKIKLTSAFRNLLTQENIISVADFALRASNDGNIISLLITLVVKFLQNEMNRRIM